MADNQWINALFSLQGKVAVINGGAGVLGLSIARGLGRAGAKIAIGDIAPTSEAVDSLNQAGIKAKGYFMNALEKETLKKACNEIMQDFGQVDILLNAAGGNIKEATTSPELTFFDLPLNALEKVVALNLFGGGNPSLASFWRSNGKKPGRWLHNKYILHECISPPYTHTRIFSSKGSSIQLYPMAGRAPGPGVQQESKSQCCRPRLFPH